MLSKSTQKKIACVILTGALTFFYAASAFATTQNTPKQAPIKIDFSKISEAFEAKLKSLVDAGTITQAQADAALKVFTSKDQRPSRLESLVNDGTITQDQANAIEEAFKSARESKKSIQDVLSSLVSSNTITQTQADSVSKLFQQKDTNGTPKDQRPSRLESLVTAGTITQDQANAIEEAFKAVIDTLKSTSN
ncbi:hypothetical protein FDN13_02375 [Caloramator sp. E03]|uniref:hypothetical protein n=1 Tax=Caloramator sp. E03 TaxID=2576307 RepID=UPI0011108155|nr:hypothetical protein [Caloramator sp. E03]QCX32637.1 hypothetical protein FDN13_02375 [Caloramator sp. E03]